jgi:hypothetical protein
VQRIRTDANTPTGITFVNNIFNSPSGGTSVSNGGSYCAFDNNAIYPQSVTTGTNTIAQDPKLVDPDNGDFHLMAGSPAIDVAKPIANEPANEFDGTLRPQGGARDLGAFEYH